MFKGCVSKDKAFYDFCKEHDLAPSSMELIIHSWWRTHDDGSMPDRDFIDKAKYGERVEMSDNDIFYAMSDKFFLYSFDYDPTPNGYFDSKEFTDRKEAEDYYRELKRMFPIKAIGSYTNSEGKIIITLAKPVITDKLKYKDYQVPTVGSKITLSSGDTYTIKQVEAKNNVEVNIWFEEKERGVTLHREESNPNTFYTQKKPRYGDSLEQPKHFVSIEGPTQSIYARIEDNKADATTVTPKFKGEMTFAYGNQRAEGVTSTTTLEAIKRGERTATTRYASDGNIDYWKQAKVGDVIEFSGQNGETVLVRVTKELHQLPKSTTAEEWSAKEGWDTSRFEQRVKPQIEKGEAYQMEFEYIGQTSTPTTSKKSSEPSFYEGNITPDEDTIFVFGSNPEGRHGAGAAKVAREQFGAEYGVGEGLTGNSYALPTKDLRVKENRGLRSIPRETIVESIQKLYETARRMPDKKFKVAYRNTDTTSLNGYTGLEMIDMFKDAGPIPSNVIFSKEWVDTGKFSSVEATPPTINIYAGTGENAELSNFAERPFILDNPITVNIEGVGPVTILDSGESFDSVEKAFQSAKIGFAYDGTLESISDEDADSFKKRIQNASTSVEAKRIGRQIPMSQTALRSWEAHKEEVIKALIKASFEQNPETLKKLLATGDAVLTHTQGTGGWDKLFPKVLMEVREELKGQEDYLSMLAPVRRDLRKINSLIYSLPKIDTKHFKNLDEVIDFIGTLADYNSRLGQLSKYLRKNKQEGKSLTKVEYDTMMGLLNDVSEALEKEIETIERVNKGEIIIRKDYSSEPIMVGVRDVYYDIQEGPEYSEIVVKEIKDGKVTFDRIRFAEDRKIKETITETLSENEFRVVTGLTGSDFTFGNLYGFADVYTTPFLTENNERLYSLEIAIPDEEYRGKGHGLEIYEAVIEELANRGAYLTPGNVVPSNHVWEALERRGRVKKVKLTNGETVFIALPKTPINKKDKTEKSEEYGQRRIYREMLSDSLEKGWKQIGTSGISRGTSERLSESENSQGVSRGNSRPLDDVVKEASESLDKELENRGIRATKQPVRLSTPKEFHKAISEAKKANPDGFMVDVHEESNYENDLLLITEDGKSGIAITPEGDIISVFSAVRGESRLEKLMFMAIAAGGKKLDCFYLSGFRGLINLYARFGFVVGATTPFNEKYAPDGFHEWKESNKEKGRNVEGVAAMYLIAESPLDFYGVNHNPGLTDAQSFSGENGYNEALEERDKILNQIEELRQKAKQPTPQMEKKEQELKAKDQEFIDSNVVLNESINKLMTSKVITAAEVNDIAMQIGNQISDEITDILNGKQETLERYKKQLEGIDVTKASRIEIARAIGIKNLIENCKNIFLNAQTTAGLSFKEAMQLAVIKDNWDAMLQFADTTFIESEGFSLLGNGEIIEDTDSQSDDINGTNDNEQLQEEIGDSRENWQIEARTRSFMKNASALVKSVLRGCYLLDENGETQTTKFGIKARVELHDAVSSIIRWTQGAQDIDEMLDALNAKVESNPWIKQVIEKLEDRESGKWADFQSQFFTAVCLREQLYSVVKARRDKNTGKITYVSIPVNKFPALKDAYSSIENQFKIGEHPMFTSKGVNESALLQLEDAYKTLVEEREKANPDKKTIDRMLLFAYHSLGYYAEEKDIAEVTKDKNSTHEILRNLESIIASLKDHKEDENYRPFAYDKDRDSGTLYNSLRGMLRPLTERLEDISVSSFYEGGKMYQTYTTPSYMTNLMAKFHQKDEAKFEKFIKEQYGSSEWFYTNGEWRLPWLDRLTADKNARNIFDHKVQLAFDKKAYMSEMGDLQYIMSIMSEYFSSPVKNGDVESTAWFRVPMLSNKSSSEFIKFYKYVGTRYKSSIVLGMSDIMFQEIARMRTVNMRNLKEGAKGYIKNWDNKGKQFNLLTFLNKYMEEKSEFGNLLRKAVSKEGLTKEENIALVRKAKEIIMREMQEKANKILDQYEKDGIIDAASSIENIGNSKEEIRDNIENFIWNDTFAAMNILELTVTDPAYYKDAVDLQKRFAQIHAPGTRPNVKATDYGDPKTGRKPAPVADKWSRTIVIKDFKILTSNIIENLEIVFDRKIRESEGATKEMYISMKDRIIKAFKDVNLTDAQAYNSPTSYRKKAILFGRWSREKEDIYQRLMKGDYNITDLEKAFGEVLKPFVYTQTVESVGKEGSPIQNIPVPFQNKNSEYLLIMADAILKGEDTGKPNLLRAIYQVMEDSAKENPTRGIDTVQFDSAIKSGLHDAISLKEFAGEKNGEFLAKEHILNSIYKRDASGNRTTEYSESVRLIDWMDYGIQQEVPEHFKNHKQAHGSQIRAIIPSELSLDAVFTVEGRPLKAGEFAKEYEETIAQNIKESLELLEKKFNIKGNRKERNIALAKILQEELNSSSRYGLDLKQACLLNEDGEFNIALGDPIQSKRIEQLINSVIKNNVNKQEIAGGPVVQVSNFGTSKSLNIRFKDKSDPSGKTLLMTEEEWNNSSNKKEKTFKEYRDNNQGGIAYFECYAPIYLDEEFFNRFADENGNIDISLIEKLDPDLLKMVGYRIPTEDKYSCAPLKIVGFLPREAGEGIMLPAEITSISGSDFDVDKMYVMRKEFRFVENRDKIHKELFESLIKSQDHALKYETKSALRELIDQFLDNPYNKEGLVNQKVAEGYISMTENAYNTLLEAYEKARKKAENTKIIWPKQGRAYRNNKIVDMTYEVLTHEDSADKILNPGGFEPQKELGYMVADIKGANSVEQNLAFIDTHVQFYKQNSAAASLIGTFAVHKVAHALLERDPLYINFRPASGLKVPMTLGNTVLDGLVKIDPTRDSEQALIGKTLGSLVASAADAAKDPVLNFMNINKDTANILTTAIRLGVPFRHAALLLSQKCMDEILHTLSQRRLKGEAASLQGVIEERLKKLKKEAGMEADGADSALLSEGLAEWQLQTGLRSADKKHEIKVLSYVNALLSLNKELKGVTLATRFNSISNATGPLIVDNLIMEEKMKDFSKHIRIYNEKTGEYKKLEDGIFDVFALHPILQEFSKGYNMARIIMRDMPLYKESFLYILDAFENLGVESIISNRDNLSKFADYYLSYILVANDVINPGDCSYYINDFPRDFLFREKCKEKYRGNPFIDAIKLTIDSNTGLSSLSIDITGLNNRQKSILMSGFIDLLSKDKEMAIKLFNYNFFRGGLGFTPKTFMSLTPLLLKQSIKGYNESYLNSPTIDPKFIIDLFIRNNWNKSEFVKFFPETHTEQTEDGPIEVLNYSMSENGDIIVSDESLYNRYKKQGYIRMKINGKDKLYKRTAVYKEIKTLTYTEVKPLGGNGAYLEFTDTPIKIKDNLELLDEDTSGNGVRKSDKQGPDDTHDDSPTPELTLSHVLSAFESALKSRDKAHEKLTEFKNKTGEEKKNLEPKIKELLRKELTKLNIPFNEDELNKIYKKMC